MPYYALFDEQVNGFKAGFAGTSKQSVIEDGANRAYELSQSDEEPCPDDLSSEEILEQYDYTVLEVTKDEYDTILNSNEDGLLTTVSGINNRGVLNQTD